MKKLKRNECLLIFGKWTSKVGDIVFDYVNNVVIAAAFPSSSWILALYQSSQTFINILFNLIGGAIADAGMRKKIIITTDFLSALVCFVTSFFIDSNYLAAALIIANAFLAFFFSFSSPAFKSIVREMVERDRIGFYNSIANAGKEILSMVGPVIGLTLMNLVGARGALLINAATFAISAISEMFLVPLNDTAAGSPKAKKNVILDIGEGFQYLWREKMIFYLVVLSSLVNFFLAGYNLLIPYTDIMYAGKFSGFYGKLMVAEAAGSIIGSFINSRLSSEVTKKYSVLVLFLALTGVSLILPPFVSLLGNIWLCLAPFFLFGAALTMFNINFMSYVQIHVAEAYLGRVFSVIFTVAVMFMPVGSFFFSAIKAVEHVTGFLILGVGILILAVLSLLLVPPNRRSRE